MVYKRSVYYACMYVVALLVQNTYPQIAHLYQVLDLNVLPILMLSERQAIDQRLVCCGQDLERRLSVSYDVVTQAERLVAVQDVTVYLEYNCVDGDCIVARCLAI